MNGQRTTDRPSLLVYATLKLFSIGENTIRPDDRGEGINVTVNSTSDLVRKWVKFIILNSKIHSGKVRANKFFRVENRTDEPRYNEFAYNESSL